MTNDSVGSGGVNDGAHALLFWRSADSAEVFFRRGLVKLSQRSICVGTYINVLTPESRIVTEPIISVSGLRGIVGESLTPEVAMRYVAAFAATLPPGPIIVSRDGRATGPMLAEAVKSSLSAVSIRTVPLFKLRSTDYMLPIP